MIIERSQAEILKTCMHAKTFNMLKTAEHQIARALFRLF